MKLLEVIDKIHEYYKITNKIPTLVRTTPDGVISVSFEIIKVTNSSIHVSCSGKRVIFSTRKLRKDQSIWSIK